MIAFHTILGFLALVAGLIVLIRPKGNRFHRICGRIYVAAMVLLCLTSFGIQELFEGFGAFHVLAIVSLVSVAGGFIPMLFRHRIKKGWFELHYNFMLFSYVGLVMATNSHFFPYVGGLFHEMGMARQYSVWGSAIVLWLLPIAIGGMWIKICQSHYKQRFADYA